MYLDKNTLPSMEDFSQFERMFTEYAKETAQTACLFPKLSMPKLRDAHYAWRDDLSRVGERESRLQGGLDHFKQCGHLTYWLRRIAPVIEYCDLAALWEEPDELYPDEVTMRELLRKYGGEYLSFDFGLQICQFYELERIDRATSGKEPAITMDYLNDICHMFKFKNVSPHAIHLIFKSLFL